jgi:osmotically inducible protein OsmC
MAFSHTLAQGGHTPESVDVAATVTFAPNPAGGFKVESSALSVTGRVPGLTQEQFTDFAKQGDQGCPVSNALRGNLEITVDAELEGEA